MNARIAVPRATADDGRCPCLSGETYGNCCAPLHRGLTHAPTAERLMRSRYSAFARREPGYLLATWHPSTRPASLELDEETRWYRLDVVSRTQGGILDSTGTVTFVAHYRQDGQAGEQRETSRFLRDRGRWFYLDGS